jgi:hypothetical protein
MAHSSWGPGWPNCQFDKINKNFYVDTVQGRIRFPGGFRNEICELVSRLVRETANRGYQFGIPGDVSYGCWGFACRAIRGRNTASNHSWGLAPDINAPRNPMGERLITDMPAWMPDLWNAYGFKWGGDYISRPDAMHYEFMGSVADAARLTSVARANRLGDGVSVPPQGDWLDMVSEAQLDAKLQAMEGRIIQQIVGNKPLIVAFNDVTPGDPDHWFLSDGMQRQEVDKTEAGQAVAEGNARWWAKDAQGNWVEEPLRVPRTDLEDVPLVE